MTNELFAKGYVDSFLEYWKDSLRSADNIVIFALIVGVVCIAIIVTGGKWTRK